MKTKIAIIGLNGIPARYGGTETFVEELTKRLRDKFQFYVMHEDSRFFEDDYNGVIRVHSPAITNRSTSTPSINDLINTIYIISKHKKEIALFYFLGPDSSVGAIVARLFGKRLLSNPDGIEWKRLIERSCFIPFYLFPFYLAMISYMYFMEWLSCKLPDITVADSINIQKFLEKQHKAERTVYVAYGARELSVNLSRDEEKEVLNAFGLEPRKYYLTVGRIVAENNIHTEIEAFKKTNSPKNLVIVGNFNRRDSYTKYLSKQKGHHKNIVFLDPIYDTKTLGILRRQCFAYIHAYEVGGTNPSLLEQMQFGRPILAYDVSFNREVLQEVGIYFKDDDSLADKIAMLERGEFDLKSIKGMQIKRIETQYSWEKVSDRYAHLFMGLING